MNLFPPSWSRATRTDLVLWALLVPHALGACRAPLPPGERCVFNDECAVPNICAGGYCRVPCHGDGDCVNDWRCRPSDQYQVRVCLSRDAPALCYYDSDCESEQGLCAADHRCHPQCRALADCQAHNTSLVCDTTRGICNWPVDAAP